MIVLVSIVSFIAGFIVRQLFRKAVYVRRRSQLEKEFRGKETQVLADLAELASLKSEFVKKIGLASESPESAR